MKSRAAILFEVGQKLEIREVDVQDPGPGEWVEVGYNES